MHETGRRIEEAVIKKEYIQSFKPVTYVHKNLTQRTPMNCVQQTMISGSHRKGWLEWAADCCLIPPACLWRGKNVSLYDDDKLAARYSSCSYFPQGNCGGGGGGMACMAIILGATIGTVAYSVAAVAASPFLILGGALKHLAFEIDPEAEEYNHIACEHLNELGDMGLIEKSLQEGCCYLPHGDSLKQHAEKIHTLAIIILILEKKLEEKNLLSIIQADIKDGHLICKHGDNQFSYVPIIKDGIVIDHEISTSSSSKIKLQTTLSEWQELLLSHENEVKDLRAQLQDIENYLQDYKKLTPNFLNNVSHRETDSFI